MAKVNALRYGRNNLLKSKSVAVADLVAADMTTVLNGVAKDGELATSDVVTLLKLPEQCVITNAYMVVKEPAKETTAQLQIKADNQSLINATAVGSAKTVLGSLVGKYFVETGAEITATVSTAALKSGVISVVIEYDELERTSGLLLNVE